MDGKRCPVCHTDVGFWAVFRALWPTRIFCPQCKSKLRYRAGHGFGMIAIVAAVGIAIVAFCMTSALVSAQSEHAFVAVLFLSWLILYEAFLLATTPLLRRYGQLSLAKDDA